MKVLFAVNNESISEQIVKKYQKEYKEIISYKNVYYFNAILKELQKDKSYDRIVIGEDLEQFTNSSYEQMDKFIFERLDSISDEASNTQGNDIPIILICSDRRTKGEQILVKLFGIGIYNAILGTDRSVDEVCRLIYKPRIKKDAKLYYRIDAEDVTYQSESENDVSEMEIQNILAHYQRLGRQEERYVESFDNIAAQYNDKQLRIICKFLPLNVKAVLEEQSPKYQKVMSFNSTVSNQIRKSDKETKRDRGITGKMLNSNTKGNLTKPVVIPSNMNASSVKRLTKNLPNKNQYNNLNTNNYTNNSNNVNSYTNNSNIGAYNNQQTNNSNMSTYNNQQTNNSNMSAYNNQQVNNSNMNTYNNQQTNNTYTSNQNNIQPNSQKSMQNLDSYFEENETPTPVVQPQKRGRGRPRKNPLPTEAEIAQKPKRGRGRPRKNPLPQETVQEPVVKETQDDALPGFEDYVPMQQQPSSNYNNVNDTLPGFGNENINNDFPGFEDYTSSEQNTNYNNTNADILPGFDEDDSNDMFTEFNNDTSSNNTLPGFGDDDSDDILPGFDSDDSDGMLPGFDEIEEDNNIYGNKNNYNNANNYNDNSYSNNYSVNNNSSFNTQSSNSFNNNYSSYNSNEITTTSSNNDNYITDSNVSNLLTGDKKLVTFVGTSKNGTSFVINNVAQQLSSMGINTAILDTTANRNSYYIYTKNEEDLRKIAVSSVEKLVEGTSNGIKVNQNLTVYTSLPDSNNTIKNSGPILETLVKNHSVVLIDCDFETPQEYFKDSQEIYLVQSMDVLTIQPLTAFLRDLKAKNILDERKIRIIINKFTRVRSVTEKTIIGGMAFYNDPAMSFMTELFDRNMAKYVILPFEEDVYTRYLEGLVNCEISLKGYSKTFIQYLKQVANMIYPLVSGKGTYKPNTQNYNPNGFSSSMNNTLSQMKQNY